MLLTCSFFSKLLGEPLVDGAYWSIVLEVIFYGWIFIIIALGQFRNLLRIVPFWLALSFLNESYIGSAHLQNLFITEHSGFFAMGIVLNRLSRQFSFYAIALFGMAIAYSIYTSLAAIAWGEQAYSVTFSPVVITAIILLSIMAFLMLMTMNINERYWRVLSISGGATYALYLVHQNVGYIAITGLLGKLSPFFAIALTVTGLIALSILYHVVIERQLNPRIKKLLLRLINRSDRPVPEIAT